MQANSQSQRLTLEQQQQLQAENEQLKQQMQQWEQQRQQARNQEKEQPPAPREADPTRGCGYLIYPQSGFTHEPGAKYCHAERLHTCDMKGKDSQGRFLYGWHVSDIQGCDSIAPSPAAKEGNLMRLQSVKVYEDD